MINRFGLKIVSILAAATVFLGGCSPAIQSNPIGNSEPEVIERVLEKGNWANESSLETMEPTWLQEEVLETITDDFGSYSRTKTSYPDLNQIVNLGIQPRELESAVQFFTDFVMLEMLDSPALDNHAAYEQWVEVSAPKFVDSARFDSVVRAQGENQVFGVIFNNIGPLSSMGYVDGKYEYMIPRLVRDGGPRVLNKKLWDIEAAPFQDGVYLRSLGSAALITTTRNLELQAYQLYLNGASTVPPNCFSEEGVIDAECSADQINYEMLIPMRFQIGLYLTPSGDSWKISSFSTFFQAFNPMPYEFLTGDSAKPNFLLELRQNLKQGQ